MSGRLSSSEIKDSLFHQIMARKDLNERDGSLISSPAGVPTSVNFFPAGRCRSALAHGTSVIESCHSMIQLENPHKDLILRQLPLHQPQYFLTLKWHIGEVM